jgi:hypothetical protein
VIEVHEGRSVEIVTAEPLEGIKVQIPSQRTLWGTIEFNLFVGPAGGQRRTVGVVGRANTAVIDDICELEEFAEAPWDLGQVAGWVSFPGLQQTAGRRALLRDREAYPLFDESVRASESAIRDVIERVNAEVDSHMTDRLSSTLRKVFGQVLKELADLDNPMRVQVGDEPGEGAVYEIETVRAPVSGETPTLDAMTAHAMTTAEPDSIAHDSDDDTDAQPDLKTATPDRPGSRRLPSIAPDPDPGETRSRFDGDLGVVLYNDRHTDYLLVKDTEPLLLDYLATLVAKEYVVYNNPLSRPDELAEELVRMLIRVRRHLPRRR